MIRRCAPPSTSIPTPTRAAAVQGSGHTGRRSHAGAAPSLDWYPSPASCRAGVVLQWGGRGSVDAGCRHGEACHQRSPARCDTGQERRFTSHDGIRWRRRAAGSCRVHRVGAIRAAVCRKGRFSRCTTRGVLRCGTAGCHPPGAGRAKQAGRRGGQCS